MERKDNPMNDTKTIAALIVAHAAPMEAAEAIQAFTAGRALEKEQAELEKRRAYNRGRQRRLRLKSLGCSDDCSRDVAATASGSENSLSDSERSEKKELVAATSRDSQTAAVEFAEFWKAYPRKVAKGAALKLWKKLKPPLAACLKALAWQSRAKEWTKDKGMFIPHPSTWLNGQRWQDEPTAGSIPYVAPDMREFVTARRPLTREELSGPAPAPVKNGHGF